MQHSQRAPLSYTYCYGGGEPEWMRLAVFPAQRRRRVYACAVAFIAAEIHRSLAALRAHNPSCEKRHPAHYVVCVCARFRVEQARKNTHRTYTNSRRTNELRAVSHGARATQRLFIRHGGGRRT